MTNKEKFIAYLRRTPKASHTIRVLAGAYLLYTAYQIFSEFNTGQNDFLIITFAVIFTVIGALLLATSLYALSNYYYAENKHYGHDEEDEESDSESEESSDFEDNTESEETEK